MLIKPDVQRFAKIKVVGLGGGGTNALNSMISLQQIQGVEFIAINTDAQALLGNQSPTKVQIGESLTRGLGSGGDPSVGQAAAEESSEKLQDVLQGADMVFLTAGMGGGTGTGSIPVTAAVAKKLGALTIAVVTKPFAFEGSRRMVVAEEGIERLRDKVDALIVIPNQRLLEVVEKNMTLQDAFKLADSVLGQGVQGISDLIVMPGLINVDFADVRAIMTNAGSALMGIGQAGGENRAATAARMAIASPLLEVSIEGAKGVLFNIVGGPDLGMNEVNEAAQIIAQAAEPDANIIFGATIKDDLVDMVKISVIATGFDETRGKLREYAGFNQSMGRVNSLGQTQTYNNIPPASSPASAAAPANNQTGAFSANRGGFVNLSTLHQRQQDDSNSKPQPSSSHDDNIVGGSSNQDDFGDEDLETPAFLRQGR